MKKIKKDKCHGALADTHIYRAHLDGCDTSRTPHYHCHVCGKVRTYYPVTKEWN